MGLLSCNILSDSGATVSLSITEDGKLQDEIDALDRLYERGENFKKGSKEEKEAFAYMYKMKQCCPPVPPVSKDTAERIVIKDLPKKMDSLVSKETFVEYVIPDAISDTLFNQPLQKPYYNGGILYKNSKSEPVISIIVRDVGYNGKALNMWLLARIKRGDTQAILGEKRNSKFFKTEKFNGHEWGHLQGDVRKLDIYATMVNQRFFVLALVPNKDVIEKIIDFEWLNKIEYPKQ